MNPPTPEGYPPPLMPLSPSPQIHQEIFSKQKGLMDYINWKDIQRKTGITTKIVYPFINKELLDNAVDYIEKYHSKLVDGPFVEVKVIKPRGCNYLRLVVINANDGNPTFNEEMIRSILDVNSKFSSKRHQFKVNKGALGDALKEVFGIPYALVRDHVNSMGDLQSKEWNEPFILRNNSTNEEFQVRLIVDRINQDYNLDIQKKTITTYDRCAKKPNTTEVEIRLPVFNTTASDNGITATTAEDEDSLSLQKSKINLLIYGVSYSLFATHIDLTIEYHDEDSNESWYRRFYATQKIEPNWKSQTSVHYYTLPQFRDFILELANDDQLIYDVFYDIFREVICQRLH